METIVRGLDMDPNQKTVSHLHKMSQIFLTARVENVPDKPT